MLTQVRTNESGTKEFKVKKPDPEAPPGASRQLARPMVRAMALHCCSLSVLAFPYMFDARAPRFFLWAVIMNLHVKDRTDLWRVLFKSPESTCRLPHIEFEIGCSQKRQIDTVYNHITAGAAGG